ncbi:SRR1-domain-containing protein [Coprinopsis sp. MPI-PUGE-AT-0042]|nr:SRR1-domain-containing protein [Coprinopsis sp. MPI-PUGE-AT-0042]
MIPTESAPSNDTAAASRVVAHVQGVCGHPVDTQGYSGARSSDASCFSYAEFTPVKHRKHRKNNKRTALNERLSTTPSQHLRRARQNLLDDGHDWLSKASHILSGALQAMSLNHCSGGSEDHDGKLDSVLCLGLGSPSSSQNANAQLAFLLEIAKALNIPTNRIAVYDPVFTEVDQQLFAELGVGSLCENKAGRYELLVPTLCFMPHCDKELYDSILQANWTPDRLRNFILVGNRLAEYIDKQMVFPFSSSGHSLCPRTPFETQPCSI